MGNRTDGPHSPGIRSRVALSNPLVVHRRRQQAPRIAIRHSEHGHFHPLQEFFDDHLLSGSSEGLPANHVLDGLFGLRVVLGHDDALPGRQATGLDHIRRLHRLQEGDRVADLSLAERAILRGGNAVALHELLGELLAAFQLCALLAGPNEGHVLEAFGFGKMVDDAFGQRGFRSDDHHVDGLFADEGLHPGEVHGVEVDILSERRRAGIARSEEEAFQQAAAGDFPTDGVLAAARSKNEYAHGASKLPSPSTRQGACFQHRRPIPHQSGGPTPK